MVNEGDVHNPRKEIAMLDSATPNSTTPSRDAGEATANPRDIIIEVASAGSSTTNDPAGNAKPPATGG